MSLALFRTELRTAVQAAQDDVAPVLATRTNPQGLRPSADVLRQVARGELSVEAALRALKSLP
jgi:hypothetical protein